MRDYYREMQGGFQHEKGYAATLGQWIQFTGRDSQGNNFDYDKDAGWKFKVAVHHDDVPKAWNIIADILLNHPYPQSAMVVTPDRLARSQENSKTISIDTMTGVDPRRYMFMMNEIEMRLREEAIRPASMPRGERPVPNSQYLSYGFDMTLQTPGMMLRGKPEFKYYPDAEPKREYNPFELKGRHHQKDPYIDFKVEVDPEPVVAQSRNLPPMLPLESTEKEFLQHDWEDANTETPITRLPLLGMEMMRAQRIMQELVVEGYKPNIGHSETFNGLAIYLKGDDASRFRQANPARPRFLQQEWANAVNAQGEKVATLSVENMSDGRYATIVKGLQSEGFQPQEHYSENLERMIQLTGKDAERLEAMKKRTPSGPR